ncbi:MAG: hypothetical protein KGM24_15280, partial [Elusimicrobia bacterium]|nr:hypothetical protein [Elusimicrobiota bacterium]
DARSALGAAYAEARAASAARCPDAAELETSFELTLDGRTRVFAYAGCRRAGRNDYLPPYSERTYRAADGDALVIVTDEGASSSEVLLWDGSRWTERAQGVSNAALASGDPVAAARATLRNAAKPLYPELAACESADWSRAALAAPKRGAHRRPETGFLSAGTGLVLLTKTAAYYYHQDCDICAELTECELSTGRLTSALQAHAIDCSDLKPLESGAVFDACAAGGR